MTVHVPHVATYGERAVDTFYVTDLIGDKIDSTARVKSLSACSKPRRVAARRRWRPDLRRVSPVACVRLSAGGRSSHAWRSSHPDGLFGHRKIRVGKGADCDAGEVWHPVGFHHRFDPQSAQK